MPARELHWNKPPDLPIENLGHIVDGLNRSTCYEAVFTRGADLEGAQTTGRVTLRQKREIPAYLQAVALGPREAAERWEPLRIALLESGVYRDDHANEDRALTGLARLRQLAADDDPTLVHEWIDELEWAVGQAPRERIAEITAQAEVLFAGRFGETDPLAYVRNLQNMYSFQVVEVLAKLEVMNPAEFVQAMRDTRPELVLENGPNHGNANYVLIPMSVAFPRWMGASAVTVSYWVLFVLRQSRTFTLLDTWHRDNWNAWIGSWYRGGLWEPLLPPNPSSFIRWYMDRLNAALRLLLDLGSTASMMGEIRPMSQLAMTRFFFHLQDLIGRLLMTSDPYTRFLLSLMAMDRFDALGWSYDVITDAGAMEELTKPLDNDETFGSLLAPWARRTWARVVRGVADESAGKLSEDMTEIALPDGTRMPTQTYPSRFMRRLRNTIHTFDETELRAILGSHSGRIPTSFGSLQLLLWLRLLADPTPLKSKFRRP